MIDLSETPYSLPEEVGAALLAAIRKLEHRETLLRDSGTLGPRTLELFYGKTRFEQIAESNAIEGSTLSVGDTELAVLRGVTLSGHDPGYVRDARSLAKALERLAEMAKTRRPAGISRNCMS